MATYRLRCKSRGKWGSKASDDGPAINGQGYADVSLEEARKLMATGDWTCSQALPAPAAAPAKKPAPAKKTRRKPQPKPAPEPEPALDTSPEPSQDDDAKESDASDLLGILGE